MIVPMASTSAELPELHHLPGFFEPFSAISHLAGAIIFVVLGAMLMCRGRGNTWQLFLYGVYAFACVFLLSMSSVYHMMPRAGTARMVMARLDHGAIFVLIAGTFTPVHGLIFHGWLRWGPLLFVWAAAITGIALKAIFFDDMAGRLGLTLYLSLGWVGFFSIVLLARGNGLAYVRPLILGGLAYTVGAALEFLGWPMLLPGIIHPHEVFHLFVLAGALFHWHFIWRMAGEVREAMAHPQPSASAPSPM